MMHPLVAVWLLIAIVLILTFPRGKAITPFLLAVFDIPLDKWWCWGACTLRCCAS